MLEYEDALKRLLAEVPEPSAERLPLEQSLGCVLSVSVQADLDLPPFDKSFVDGYALRSEDVVSVPARLEVIGTVAAGSQERPRVNRGEAVQVMTGAAVPPGADAVQMVEKTRPVAPHGVEILESIGRGGNYSPKGNEVRRGTTVLEAGRLIGPAEVGVLATFGREHLEVHTPPSAAVIATGDELVDIAMKPEFGQIRNSNAYMLSAQCRQLGLEVQNLPVVPDDPDRTRDAVARGLDSDLVLFSGGVSMGESDYVHRVLAQEGVEICFHRAAIKPGKPILVGRKDNHMVFGLPGNPVSAFVTFELFVRPAVCRWMGMSSPFQRTVLAELMREVTQKPGRKFFKPAHTVWSEGRFKVEPIETRGSADLVAFSPANSLLIMEADEAVLAAGDWVPVMLLDGGRP